MPTYLVISVTFKLLFFVSAFEGTNVFGHLSTTLQTPLLSFLVPCVMTRVSFRNCSCGGILGNFNIGGGGAAKMVNATS